MYQLILDRIGSDVDREAVRERLVEHVGSEERAEELIEASGRGNLIEVGGTILHDRGWRDVRNVQAEFEELGVRTLIDPVGAGDHRVRLLDSVEGRERELVREFLLDLALGGDENRAVELVENGGVVMEGLPEAHARRIRDELVERGGNADVERSRPPPDHTRVVEGSVRRETDDGLEQLQGVTVRVSDQDFDDRRPLGEDRTDDDGRFRVSYTLEGTRAGEADAADLVFGVFNEADTELPAKPDRETRRYKGAEVLPNAGAHEVVDLIVEAGAPVTPSEFEVVAHGIEELDLGETDLRSLADDEREFVTWELGVDREAVDAFVASHRLAAVAEADGNLPPGVFYGLVRQGYPSNPEEFVASDTADLLEGLSTALDRNLVPRRVRDSVDDVEERFNELRTRRRDWDRHRRPVQLVAASAGEADPLAGYVVHVVDAETGAPLADAVADREGRVTLDGQVPQAESAVRTLRLTVRDPRGETIPLEQDTFEGVDLASDEEWRLRIPRPEPAVPGTTDLTELRPDLGVEIPDELLTWLDTAHSINTVADVRMRGGIRDLPELPLSPEDPSVARLEAHAQLTLLPTTTETNEALIERGYTSPFAIASTPRSAFLRAMTEAGTPLDRAEAERLHVAARAERYAVENVLVGRLTDRANNLSTEVPDGSGTTDGPAQPAPRKCTCDDCESAVSPVAYLADLFAYVTEYVRREDGTPIDLDDLSRAFSRPFAALEASCEATDRRVRQVRLCIEILRRYLADNPPADAAAVATGEQAYRQAAYDSLLDQLGTSRDELERSSRDPAVRDRVADRIGVPTDRVDDLYFPRGEIPESELETLFGLRDTTATDVFAERETPAVVEWQLRSLRDRWMDEDLPSDPFLRNERPIVDPDVIGPDDFRSPVASPQGATTETAFDIWIVRREWVDDQLDALAAETTDDGTPDPDGMFRLMTEPRQYRGTPVDPTWGAEVPAPEEFEALRDQLREGPDRAEAKERVERLQLTEEAFLRLVALRTKHGEATADTRKEAVSDAEWREFRSILVGAHKRQVAPIWIEEETEHDVDLDAERFWPSLREPSVGEWSRHLESARPLIDPEHVGQDDLPDTPEDTTAVDLREERDDELDNQFAAIKMARESGGFEHMLDVAYPARDFLEGGGWGAYLDGLNADLTSHDAAVVESAKATLDADLGLTAEEFDYLLSVRSRTDARSDKTPPGDTEWRKLYRMLTTAWKREEKYPEWRTEEETMGLDYWRALKARLPEWRASPEAHDEWRLALERRSSPPLLDPDVVGADELADPSPTDAASTLWQQRRQWVRTEYEAIESTSGDSAAARFDAMLSDVLGISAAALAELDTRRARGQPISDRLDQLTIDRAAFEYLVGIHERIEQDEAVSDDQWENVYHILVQVCKRRAYGRWRRAERAEEVFVAPTPFALSADAEHLLESDQPRRWRVDDDHREAWAETLETRIDVETDIRTSHEDAVGAVEEETLSILRDALVDALDTPDGVTDPAEWVADRLLVDAKTSGCEETTRISAAIEAMHSLVFAIRTGQDEFNAALDPPLELVDEDFDERWEWLGSYETWKSAMVVFLYPETVLQPSLRRSESQTPAFRELVATLRGGAGVKPRDARAAAKRYQEYFRDVATIRVDAACWAPTRVHDERGDGETTRKVLHLFGVGGETGTIYWSRYDPARDRDHAHTAWKPLPLEADAGSAESDEKKADGEDETKREERSATKKVERVLGAGTFNGQLYTFVKTTDNRPGAPSQLATHTLEMIRIDLETLEPEDAEELSLPVDTKQFETCVVEQRADDRSPPKVALQHRTGGPIYTNYLNVKGTDWGGRASEDGDTTEDGWTILRLQDQPAGTSAGLEAFVQCEIGEVVFTRDTATEDYDDHYLSGYNFTDEFERVVFREPLTSSGQFLGTIFWSDADDNRRLSVCWGDGWPSADAPESAWVRTIDQGPQFTGPGRSRAPFLEQSSGFRRARKIARQNGVPPGDGGDRFRQSVALAPWRRPGDVLKQGVELPSDPSQAGITTTDRMRLAPTVEDPSSRPSTFADPRTITADLSGADRQWRREFLETTWDDHATEPESTMQYLREAYYFVPVHLALQLQQGGQYTAALDWFRSVYDYETSGDDRKIYPGLRAESSLSAAYERDEDWLLDPLNPHRIATKRRHAYTRYTLFAIVRCLLDYADGEFTRDTAESVPRARTLYRTALGLMGAPELERRTDPCDTLSLELDGTGDDPVVVTFSGVEAAEPVELASETLPVRPIVTALAAAVGRIDDYDIRYGTIEALAGTLADEGRDLADRFVEARTRVADARRLDAKPQRYEEVLGVDAGATPAAYRRLVANPKTARHVAAIGAGQSAIVERRMSAPPVQWPRRIPELELDLPVILERPKLELPEDARPGGFEPAPPAFTPTLRAEFCVPENPILRVLRLRTDENLRKLRNCMNIAGMRRQLDPYAAPIDVESSLSGIGADGQLRAPGRTSIQPTPYRYRTLIERTKEAVNHAQGIEAAFLSALEKYDRETYDRLKARQDADVAEAGVRLQERRVTEAEDGVELAELQRDRAQIQADTYKEWIDAGLNEYETVMIGSYLVAGTARAIGNELMGIGQSLSMLSSASAGGFGAPAAVPLATAAGGFTLAATRFNTTAIVADMVAQVASVHADHERRKQEWELQKNLANQDLRIGQQQIRQARHHLDVIEAERDIAELQAEHAEAIGEFLDAKFTSADLYEWMSGVLEGVFRYFLQQATAMAKVAENQLAFERQEVPPAFIEADYWEPPTEDGGDIGSERADRRGLTGSARMLQDIDQLDQYAFETDEHKHQLTKTISLASLHPLEFQRFRETGVLQFETPMELFDRDFPGHYLRLIKQVRTSVVALVPPTEGIKSTLSNSGLSRVVTGDDVFRTSVVRRPPESVSLTSPQDATGLFELQPENQEMLLPFEGTGVDTRWQLRMPKAANRFDYESIADVLVTIEYTALHSDVYRQQVVEKLDDEVTADRSFGFRREFADQWYDLHNPDGTAEPMTVRFETERDDFPRHVEDPEIKDVLLYLAGPDPEFSARTPVGLTFREQGATANVGGTAVPNDGVVSTRRPNGSRWKSSMAGKSPVGEWTLSLPDTPEMRAAFDADDVDDILFVITYEGQTPDWPP